jgi:integrase
VLTDKQCKGARTKEKAYKLADGEGLHLFVTTTGYRSWRHKYRFGGKEKLRALGCYPQVGLADARKMLAAGKRLLAQGKDPIAEAERASLAARVAATETFELLAREWFEKSKQSWRPVHADDVITSLERDVFGDLGAIAVTAIDEGLVLATLKKVADRGAVETAHRLRQRVSAVFQYGKAKKCVGHDPAKDLGEALKKKPWTKLRPAVVTIKEAREVVAATDKAAATPIVRLASRFTALTAQRPGMVRWLEWNDIAGFDPNPAAPDLDAAAEVTWTVPADKLKQELELRKDQAFAHPVPLAPAAVDVLRQAWLFSAGSRYVFPGGHSVQKPMSENALSYLLARGGYKGRHVPHGWRSTFSSLMNEWTNDSGEGRPRDPLVIDLMLAHTPSGLSATELRYMRSAFIDRRRALAVI